MQKFEIQALNEQKKEETYEKNKSKSIETILPAVGKYLGVVLVVSLFSASYSAENNNSTTWDNVQEKVSDASDAVATKTKKAYHKTKDVMTPDHSDKSSNANDVL